MQSQAAQLFSAMESVSHVEDAGAVKIFSDLLEEGI